jgi:phage/plasmid primase-like uncharacterized protein
METHGPETPGNKYQYQRCYQQAQSCPFAGKITELQIVLKKGKKNTQEGSQGAHPFYKLHGKGGWLS